MFDSVEALLDDCAAAARFPGPDYYEVLSWIHSALRPAVYLELGVLHGGSLRLAQPPTLAIGVDPNPGSAAADSSWPTKTQLHRLTAREFFAARLDIPPVSFAFIDAHHRFEEVLADFLHVESIAANSAIVAIHDTVPLSARTAARERTTEFYTGDVWKILAYFALHRPGLDVITVRTAPTGLTLVRCVGPCFAPAGHPDIAGLSFQAHADLRTIPNSRDAIAAWLLRQ